MGPKTAALYKIAKEDKKFCEEMRSTDGNFVPGFFADTLEKSVFTAVYCGYLLKQHGVDGYNAIIRDL